jgi:peptidyl-prolyl cis-trans isomerase B (cyclophilin B)
MPPRLTVIAAAVLVLAASGCGKDDTRVGGTAATSPATAPTGGEKDAAGCLVVPAPKPRAPGKQSRPTLRLSAGRTYTVTLKTNCGDIAIELDVEQAPKTTASFASLVKRGFYDGLSFHRVLADFVVQGGDPLGNGQGGPGYDIVEPPPRTLRYTRGIVAMAKAQVDPPGSSGSQFFIVTGEDAGLTPDYALVGKVTSGFETLNRIVSEPVSGPEGAPQNPVVIDEATIEPAP